MMEVRSALLFLLLIATTCPRPALGTAAQAAPDTALAFRVFLIGGAGGDGSAPVLSLLKSKLVDAPPQSMVIFLGDNVSPSGMPDSGDIRRAEVEQILLAQIDALRDFPGRIVFIPGDYDWATGGSDGFSAALRQEAFVEEALQKRATTEYASRSTPLENSFDAGFLPDGGLPGPTAVELSDAVVLIVINTQWWLHSHEKPYGDDGDVDLELDEDFLLKLDDLLDEYRKETVLVVGHHPIASSGPRAGRYPLRSHLFPLTEVHPSAYVPLPLIGSLPFLYVRHFGASRQDLAHPRYASLREHLGRIFDRHERLIYASAHERSLQYFKTAGRVDPRGHLLVSGSASGASYTADESRFDLAEDKPGFMILDFYEDGSVRMEAWTSHEGGQSLYRTELEGPDPDLQDPEVPELTTIPDLRGKTMTRAANPDYAAGGLHRFIFGRQYRQEWATPIRVPYLDMSRDAGGLTLLRRGGGVQTASLRFRANTGIEYVARTIDKDPTRTLPPHLQSALVEKVVLDFNSSLHPYGALIVTRLADAAGVYHTNPMLRIIPDDPRLGRHREDFAGRLVLVEERPDEDLSALESFGRSDNVIGTPKLFIEVNADIDHRVDQRAYVRARLLDMLIADWDRHWDQWRWASFEPADSVGKIYRPVPRDRDWAFSKFDGVIPSLAKYVIPHFQGFSEDYGSLKGLNHKAKSLDRRFATELTEDDWVEIADSIRASLTDEVIEEAVRALPDPIFAVHGEETVRILIARREGLTRVAKRYYHLNARVVDVLGSDKHERFEVSDAADGGVRVTVFKTSKSGSIRMQLYERTFIPDETKEIRLYGQGGRDQFILNGSTNDIRIRVIGGAGEDRFINQRPDERANTVIYDTDTENTWEVGSRTTQRVSDDPAINLYDRTYQYNQVLPIVAFGTNNTQGVVLGGGAHIIRHGFRRAPYANSHRISAEVATKTLGINVDYTGHVTSFAGAWNAGLDAEYRASNNVRNFYGLGNETREENRLRVNFGGARMTPLFDRKVGAAATIRVGPTVEFTRVSEDEGLFPSLPGLEYGDRWSIGALAGFLLDGRDDVTNPKQGVVWNTEVGVHRLSGDSDELFSKATSVFNVYATPRHAPQVTFALRAGGAHIFGDFPFYAASTLGGDDNLRGYRSSRFGGRSSLFQNLEARIELFRFSTYVAPGHLGILGFVDNGRVWLDDEGSRTWHQTFGGGLWMRVFDRFILNGTMGWSEETTAFVLRTGFQF